MPIIGFSLIFSIIAIVHVIKTGRSQLWIMALLSLPGLGVLAYLIVEILPELMQGRASRKVTGKLSKALHQGRDFNEAKNDYELSGSVQSACNLAELHSERGEFSEAEGLYQQSLVGLNERNPDIMHKLASVQFELNKFNDAKQTLDKLIEKNPQYKNQDAHLLYARTLDAMGDFDAASEEYQTLVKYYTGPEPAYRFAKMLQQRGDTAAAASLFEDIIKKAKMSPGHYQSMHSEWISKARREV